MGTSRVVVIWGASAALACGASPPGVETSTAEVALVNTPGATAPPTSTPPAAPESPSATPTPATPTPAAPTTRPGLATAAPASPTPTLATPSPTPAPLVLRDLTLTANPAMVLSCWVRWRTDAPAASRVEVSSEGGAAFHRTSDALVTEHEVLVLGLHAETSYQIVAASSRDGGRWDRAEAGAFTTGALPPEVYTAEVTVREPGLMAPGWTLTNNHNKQLGHDPTAVIYDEGGQVVWYHVNRGWDDDLGSVDTSFTRDGTVLIGPSGLNPAVEITLDGQEIWRGPPQPNTGTDQAHHHCGKLENGEYVTLVRRTQDGRYGDEIVQYDADHTVRWSWNPFEHLEAFGDADWTHNNSVTVDLGAAFVYLNSRNLSAVYKIDRIDGRILWTFGKGGDFAADTSNPYPWPQLQHDPEVQPSGNLLIYDNGGSGAGGRPFTRVVEYSLDEEAHTSRIVWEWPGTFDVPAYYRDGFFAPVGGDANRLENGNTLITIAMRTSEAQPSRLVEVDPRGRVVWEALLPMTADWVVGAYRAERIPAMVRPL